jgi:hypothetical protein
MPNTLTEGQHAGEFILYELDLFYNRLTKTVSSGQKLVDGQLVQLSGGELIAKNTTLNTAQTAFTTAIEGILIGNWDASATGSNADIPNVPYLKYGPAIVVEEKLTFPAGATQKTVAIADLTARGILVRNTTSGA